MADPVCERGADATKSCAALVVFWVLIVAAAAHADETSGDGVLPAPTEVAFEANDSGAPAANDPSRRNHQRQQISSRPDPRGAESEPRGPRARVWDVYGRARVRHEAFGPFDVDRLGTPSQDGRFTATRLVLGGRLSPNRFVHFFVEGEGLTGRVQGDRPRHGTSIGGDTFRHRRHERFGSAEVLLRRAFVAVDGPIGMLAVGRQTFTWGTGLMANDGLGDRAFGDGLGGSLVDRVAVVMTPFDRDESATPLRHNLEILLAGDLVARDDNASRSEGDRAWAVVGGARTRSDRVALGGFVSWRHQTDRRDRLYPEPGWTEVDVLVTDVHARVTAIDVAGQRLVVEAEGAMINGSTTRPYLEETVDDPARVHSLGGVAIARYDHDAHRLTAALEAGYASGDNDPRDDIVRQFSMHSDYTVGLVLFEHVLPLVNARSIDRVNDPALVAVSPSGLRHTVNQGAVSNATYVNPTVRWRPVGDLDLRVGWLWARTAADLVDVYETARVGGYNTTPGGATPGARSLGHELDASVRYPVRLPAAVGVDVGADGGVHLPGAALDGVVDDPVWIARGRLDLTW